MLSERMREAINDQLNAELYSAYLYLSMSAYLSSINLLGFAGWMRIQRLEEITHAMKLYDYVIESGGRVWLKAIEGPPTAWDGALGVFETAYGHEQKVTGLIKDLATVAVEEEDRATLDFLKWFVDEQVEEEESADEVVQKIKQAEGDLSAIDNEMAARAFKPQSKGVYGGVG